MGRATPVYNENNFLEVTLELSLTTNFQIVNLCNGGTKDFVELWEIIHLNIWTQLT